MTDQLRCSAGNATAEHVKQFVKELRNDGNSWAQPRFNSAADLIETLYLMTLGVPNEPQALPVTRECRCAHPMIECGQTGCRCKICGEPERLSSQVSRPAPQAAPKLSDFAELKLLIDEYDPENSDWNFRQGVLLDILVRVWPTSSQVTRPQSQRDEASPVVSSHQGNCK